MLNNFVKLSGEIISNITISHEYKNNIFATFELKIFKDDIHFDIITILTNMNIITSLYLKQNDHIQIEGEFHSYNSIESNHNKLLLFCFAKKITKLNNLKNTNYIFLNGYICKDYQIRKNKNYSICDILIAVNRKYKKSDYIPCVILGDNINAIINKKVGDQISFEGKVQSRKYIKKISNEIFENKIAYEILIEKIYL